MKQFRDDAWQMAGGLHDADLVQLSIDFEKNELTLSASFHDEALDLPEQPSHVITYMFSGVESFAISSPNQTFPQERLIDFLDAVTDGHSPQFVLTGMYGWTARWKADTFAHEIKTLRESF